MHPKQSYLAFKSLIIFYTLLIWRFNRLYMESESKWSLIRNYTGLRAHRQMARLLQRAY